MYEARITLRAHPTTKARAVACLSNLNLHCLSKSGREKTHRGGSQQENVGQTQWGQGSSRHSTLRQSLEGREGQRVMQLSGGTVYQAVGTASAKALRLGSLL